MNKVNNIFYGQKRFTYKAHPFYLNCFSKYFDVDNDLFSFY
jgi:hypothetical protein